MKPLDHLAQILEASPVNRQVFFRNDDGGWADRRLQSLCDCFVQLEIPLDIAVIPKALTSHSVKLLKSISSVNAGQFHLHQHGYAHINHQKEGRSCEFGSARTMQQQLDDISDGQRILRDNFQAAVEPIFTPPWNRCSSDTPAALEEIGISLLSRITGSDPVGGNIIELPVAIDWLKKKKGVQLAPDDIVNIACREFEVNNPFVGIMLHHEHMDQDSREQLADLVAVLKKSNRITFTSMLSTRNSIRVAEPANTAKQESSNREST